MKDTETGYEKVLNGYLGIGHRPKLKGLKAFREQGVTHIWTLLSEKEGALDIKKASIASGLDWEWLSLANGKPPEESLLPEIINSFERCKRHLENGAKIYLHCSAGIHRTGMISYAFLRLIGKNNKESLDTLTKMRSITSEGVGIDRLEWGDLNFG